MRKMIFNVCRKLYFKGVIPWKVWSPVYDRWHRLALNPQAKA